MPHKAAKQDIKERRATKTRVWVENEDVLNTGNNSFWIDQKKPESSFEWWFGYGLREWFRHAGVSEESVRLQLLLQTSDPVETSPKSDEVDLYWNPVLMKIPTFEDWSMTLFVLNAEGDQ